MTFGNGSGDSLSQTKSRISCGVLVEKRSLSSEVDGRKKKSSLVMFNCEHCHLSPETICHALRECPKITEVWEAILGFEFRQLHNFPWFRDLVLFIQAGGKNLELLAMVLWTIWFRRNQLRVGSKDFRISQVVPQASHALSDIKQFNVSLPSWQDGISNSWAWSQWLPPPRDYSRSISTGLHFQN